jgi:hypothetical protein
MRYDIIGIGRLCRKVHNIGFPDTGTASDKQGQFSGNHCRKNVLKL